jgi:hypothetical protein
MALAVLAGALLLAVPLHVALHRSQTEAQENAEAEERAQQLLVSMLSPAELQQLSTCGFIEIESRLTPGRSTAFRIGPDG